MPFLGLRSSSFERLKQAQHFQYSCRPVACGIDLVGSIRYSVRSVLGVPVIECLPWCWVSDVCALRRLYSQ
eukprot:9765276-Alexandrium_andersonii.AAC.1